MIKKGSTTFHEGSRCLVSSYDTERCSCHPEDSSSVVGCQLVEEQTRCLGSTGTVGKLSMEMVDPPELAETELLKMRYWGAASPEQAPGLR